MAESSIMAENSILEQTLPFRKALSWFNIMLKDISFFVFILNMFMKVFCKCLI